MRGAGGEEILPLLSKDPAPKEIPILLVFSVIFQLSLFFMKKMQSRKRGSNYITDLRRTLVENVLNTWGLLIILLGTLVTCTTAIIHVMRVDDNLEAVDMKLNTLMPGGVVRILSIMAFGVGFPFLKQHALR